MNEDFATDYASVVQAGENHYAMQAKAFRMIQDAVGALFKRWKLESAIPLAEVTHVEDSWHVSFRWRPVYDVSVNSPLWDEYDEYAYENLYSIGLEVFANPSEDLLQVGFKCDVPKNLVITETGVRPYKDIVEENVEVNPIWANELRKIIAHGNKPRPAAAPNPTGIFGKIKASIALRKK